MSDAKIDIVIPTMWRAPNTLNALTGYANSPLIRKIVLIDNAPAMRPAIPRALLDRLTVVSHENNVYVNPAWNEGVSLCCAEIVCIANDDITIEDSLFEEVASLDWEAQRIDLIGLGGINLDAGQVNTEILRTAIDKSRGIGDQFPTFGACMFMPRRNYSPIPPDLKVWYGDDFLIHANRHVYVIRTPLVKGGMSVTVHSFDSESDIHRVIQEDIAWARANLLARV